MTYEQSNEVIHEQVNLCLDLMTNKNAEYSRNSDRLHNFRAAAMLRGISVREALIGMMAKHTVSIYDMAEGCTRYDLSKWEEKITDHINYLLLLKCAICEEEEVQKELFLNTKNSPGEEIRKTRSICTRYDDGTEEYTYPIRENSEKYE